MTKTPCSVPECDRPAYSRTACKSHYNKARYAGTLEATLPRKTRRSVDMLEDYDFLVKTEGLNARQAAERMGVTVAALNQARHRRSKAASSKAMS